MSRELYATSILLILALSLLPGYARASVGGRIVNVEAWTNVVLLAILSTHFLIRPKKSAYILYLAALFFCAAMLGYVSSGDSEAVVKHAFSFAPFVVAFLLLELDVGTSFRGSLLALSAAAAIGAIMANVIQWFRPDLLGLVLKEEDDIAAVLTWGRVSWSGYVATLPLLAQLGFLNIYAPAHRGLALVSISIILVGTVLTFNRTTLVAVVVLLGYLLVSRRRDIGLGGLVLLGVACAGASAFLSWWSQVNPNLMHLIEYRIFSFISGDVNVAGDVSTRQGLYSEYLERLTHSLFLGQGLGVPLSTFLGSAMWADVTFVSVAIPFGVFGIALFIAFLRRLYTRIQTRMREPRIQRLFVLVFVLALAVSLNDDIWTHKNFIIYFVFLVNSYCRGSVENRARIGADVRSAAPARA